MAEHQPNAPEVQAQGADFDTPEIREKKLNLEFAMQELQRAQKELAIAQGEVDFGKFDVTVPNEGEHTYSSYLEQRPTEADAEGEQNLTGQAYYDHKYNLVNEGERTPYAHMTMEELRKERAIASETNDSRTEHEIRGYLYEQMGVVELAKEAANARQSGDAQEEQRIREALEHHLTMDAMQDDSKSAEKAQEDYDDNIEHYDKLVNRFVERGQAQPSHAADAHDKQPGQGQPSVRLITTGPDKGTADKQAKQDDRTYGGYFKGMKVSVARVHPHESDSSKDMLEVVGEDGRLRRIPASEFKSEPSAQAKEPGKDLVLASSTRELPKVDDAPEKETRLDKMKAWFKDKLPDHQRSSGNSEWRERWARVAAGFGPKDRVLDHEVTDEMTEEQKEEKRRKNRTALLIGGWAAAAVAMGTALVLGANHDSDDLFKNEPTVSAAPSPEASEAPQEKEDEPVIPENNGTRWTEGDLNGEVELSDPIPHGGGGEELFTNLGMDASAWYNNENDLLQRFPDEFYRMADGHVGIAQPGVLSQEVQDYVKTLQ